ncbi:peptide/nickel transport system permease protein [Pseudooceanicola antarcticus]|uniref:ABC transporter permease n=1 Tax=Pseudooceanicola antarcticus TaxID=1247613 RepID=A0A285JGN4_9RHOB|nr:ABC transporter permease [Pseudooceanicola antarcticus]PJE26369.1 ABC transporter permease [Pseudooceanicola antarcticus]SNY59233.1 peptide/nickel transport system permease protein [Pseudooceanicola antarcticus]
MTRDLSFKLALGLLVVFVLVALFGPYLLEHDPLRGSLRARLDPPAWAEGGSAEHLLGTDRLGRDVLARIVQGARISLAVCLVVIAIAGSIGTALGTFSGYVGGWVDRVLMRLVDLALSLPVILLALLFAAVVGPSFLNIVIVISMVLWSQYARMSRGETLRVKNEDYVDLARTSGLGHVAIIFRHVLPNIAPSLIVVATLQVGVVIVLEASLSFLGVGVPPPNPSWGGMVAEGRSYIVTAWWVSALPGIAIVLVVMAVNVVGDALTDRINPGLRGRGA